MSPSEKLTNIREYVAARPKSPAGHPKFTHDEACGLQHLTWDYQQNTRLTLHVGSKERTIKRPTEWVKREPTGVPLGKQVG